LETGIYNLTQDQTPVLCHFGTSQHQTYLIARLPEPEHEAAPAATPVLPGREPGDQPPAAAPAPPAPDGKEAAAALAAVDPTELKAVQPADWLALGTFSMAVKDSEVDPARVIQLAVSKNGLISGTIHNRTSGNTYAVQGRVDKETQRVAFTIEDDSNTVMETGIFNLTQDQTPVLCHFGTSATQVYMLARLPQPEHEPAEATTPPLPGTPPAPGADAPPAPGPAPAAPPTGADTAGTER